LHHKLSTGSANGLPCCLETLALCVRRVSSSILVLLLAACADPLPVPDEPVRPAPASEPIALPKVPAQSTPAKAKPKRPGPIPTRPLEVKADCRFRDETGYSGTMKLAVAEAKVQTFEAAVSIPNRGACRFDLKNFRQTREMPNVELRHRRDPCVVRVWEQEHRVTVAFQQCQKMCSGSAWHHLWPILTDRRDGSCA